MAENETLKDFESVLADWGVEHGFTPEDVAFDENGEVTLEVGSEFVTLSYRDESDTVILWSDCGEVVMERSFQEILLGQYRFAESRGFTIGYEPESNRAAIFDRRPAERFTSAGVLDLWLTAAATMVSDIRTAFVYGADTFENYAEV